MENAVVKVKCNIATQYVGCNCYFCENYALINILRKKRHSTTNWKVMGLIPGEVIGFFS
jgi:hypothetical protein